MPGALWSDTPVFRRGRTRGARLHGHPFRPGRIVQNVLSTAIKVVRHGGTTEMRAATGEEAFARRAAAS